MDRNSAGTEVEVDVDVGVDPSRDDRADDEAAESSGRLAGVRGRLPSLSRPWSTLFSPSAFATALLLGVGAMILGTVVPLPGARFGLLVLVTFAYGGLSATRRYAECAAAGAVAAGAGFLLSVALGGALVPVVAGYGPEIAGVSVGAGALAALVGHYFGRDLRAGWVD
ncbi:MAG: hypothetical protein ABEJ43_10285 [Haloferacaceae archaeon]